MDLQIFFICKSTIFWVLDFQEADPSLEEVGIFLRDLNDEANMRETQLGTSVFISAAFYIYMDNFSASTYFGMTIRWRFLEQRANCWSADEDDTFDRGINLWMDHIAHPARDQFGPKTAPFEKPAGEHPRFVVETTSLRLRNRNPYAGLRKWQIKVNQADFVRCKSCAVWPPWVWPFLATVPMLIWIP